LFTTKAENKVENFEEFFGQFFPELETRLRKKAIRFMIANCDWEMVEVRLRGNLRLLGLATEDFFFKENFEVVDRWISVYGLEPEGTEGGNGVLKKVEICEYVLGDFKKKMEEGAEIVKNRLIDEDYFGKAI
jgi:hypothetical protein